MRRKKAAIYATYSGIGAGDDHIGTAKAPFGMKLILGKADTLYKAGRTIARRIYRHIVECDGKRCVIT